MASEPGTLEQLVNAIAALFDPLRRNLVHDPLELLSELGISFPDVLAADPAFTNALETIAGSAAKMPDLLNQLTVAVAADDAGLKLKLDFDLIKLIRDLIDALTMVAGAIDAQKNSFPGLSPADVAQFAAELPKRLLDYLVVHQLERLPSLSAGLDFVGIIERTPLSAGSLDPFKPPFTLRQLHLGAIADFLKTPGKVLEDRYAWGAAGFDGRALLAKLEKLALELGLPAVYTDVGVPTLDVMFLEVQPKTDVVPPGLRMRLHSPLKADNAFSTQGEQWTFEFKSSMQAPVQSVLTLVPDGTVTVTPPSGTLQGETQHGLRHQDDTRRGCVHSPRRSGQEPSGVSEVLGHSALAARVGRGREYRPWHYRARSRD